MIWLLSTLWNYPLVLVLGLLILLGYSFESSDTLTLNYHADCFDFDNSGVNLLLSNNLNKYHPFIFYVSVAVSSGIILQGFLSRSDNSLFRLNHLVTNYNYYITLTLVLNLTSLFMGSWWALQEGTWGGWWNWDASEVLGLLITMGALYYLHTPYYSPTIIQVQIKLTFLGFITLLSYTFIQLNFDLVSHNFGSKFFFFFNNNLFLLEMMFVAVIRIGLLKVTTYVTQSQITLLISPLLNGKLGQQTLWWQVLALYLLLGGLLGSSFLPLLNYFIWSYLGLNSFNFHPVRPLLVTLLMLTILLAFTSRQVGRRLIFLNLWVGGDGPLVGLLSRLKFSLSLVAITHLLLSLMALSNLSSYDCNFIQWYDYGIFQELYLARQVTMCKQTSFVCDSFWVESATLYTAGYYSDTFSWNIFYGSNTPSLQTFLLQYNTATLHNLYKLSTGWANSALFIEFNYLNNLFESWGLLTLYSFIATYYRWTAVKVTY